MATKHLACLLSLTILLVPLGASSALAAPTGPLVRLGMDQGSAAAFTAAGAPPAFGSFWIGAWTASSGWGALDSVLSADRAQGITPLVYWYYWGDSISPSCVESGCGGKSRAQWDSMTVTLADHIRNVMGGAETLVILENEFNKGGITDPSYAPTFDAYLTQKAGVLHGVPGVKVVLGFGSWGEDAWGRFPRAIAASDLIGFQLMRASTRDSEANYRASPDKIAANLGLVRTISTKPAILYDLALSSYPDATYSAIQADTLRAIMARRAEYASAGLTGIVYREFTDNPSMGLNNYFGIAEQYWGLRGTNGALKPSWSVWRDASNSSLAPPAPAPAPSVPPQPAPGSFHASFQPVPGNEWWVQTRVTATLPIGSVCASVAGAACQTLTLTPWGDHAASIHVLPGSSVTFTAIATTGERATSGAYLWPQATPIGAPPPGPIPLPPPTPAPAPAPAPAPIVAPVTVSFHPYDGNDWWVQTRVTPADTIQSVCASIDNGACVPLVKRAWGAWAASLHAPAGSRVVFTATTIAGTVAVSPTFVWPTGAPTTPIAFPVPAPAPAPLPVSPPPTPPPTPPSAPAPVLRLAAYGDTGTNPTTQAIVNGAIASGAQGFLGLGDYEYTATVSEWSNIFAPLTSRGAYMALGNHDDVNALASFFPRGTSWSMNLQGARIVALDTQQRVDVGSAQYDAARGVLCGAPESLRVLVMHKPWWLEGGAVHPGSEFPGSASAMDRLVTDCKVSLVLAGHEHNYQRMQRNGATYVIVGTGGQSHYALAGVPAGTVATSTEFGRLELDIVATGYSARFVSVDGVQRDTFSAGLPAAAPVPPAAPTPAPAPGPAPSPSSPPTAFTATFAPRRGNEWWVQVGVTSNAAVASVCASVDAGSCQALTLRSWGDWAASFHVPIGSMVTFTARSATGQVASSAAYAWPSATPVAPGALVPPPPPGTFAASFRPVAGNDWWIQVAITSTQPVANVCVSVDEGACQALTRQVWGDWASSIHAPAGSRVSFTATTATGAIAKSGAYAWPGGTPI